MSFTSLLIQICTIQSKALSTTNYEQIPTWTNLATNVPTRRDAGAVKITDTELRENNDDDLFFFNPDVAILRGHRIVLDGENYDVIDVNKVLDSTGVHHLEVVGRITDNK